MVLNNYSYVHKKIRSLCYLFEQSTQLQLVTNLSNDFDCIKFCNAYSYVTIDFANSTIFVMCIKLDKSQFALIEDILIYTQWLHLGTIAQQNRNSKMLQNRYK